MNKKISMIAIFALMALSLTMIASAACIAPTANKTMNNTEGVCSNANMTMYIDSQYERYYINQSDMNLTLYGLGTYSTVINRTTILQNSTATKLNQTLMALGKCVQVLKYATSTQPYLYDFNDTCGITSYSYTAASKRLDFSCTNGTYIFANIQSMAGQGGVNVYHDGVFVERTTASTYTVSSCSSWSFYPSFVALTAQERTLLVYIMPIIVLAALIMFILDTFMNGVSVKTILYGAVVALLTAYMILGIVHAL